MLELAKEQAETAVLRDSELRERIENSNFELKAANEGLQKFTSIIAHDLRAPLRRIDAFTDALREGCASQHNEDGNEILTRVDRMKLMLDALLDYSRYNAKAIAGKTADLSNVIDRVIESCDFQQFESRIRVNVQDVPRLKGTLSCWRMCSGT